MFSIKNKFSKIVILAICISMLTLNFNVFAVENAELQGSVNLINEGSASCEVLDDFLTYENPEPEKGNVGREINSDYYRSGNSSLKITIPGSYRTLAGFKPTEALVEGESYSFSIWYYNPDNTTGTLYLRYAIPYSISGWLTGTAHDCPSVQQSGGWHKYEVNFVATSDIAEKLTYFYITSTSTSGTIYFDDISLVKKAETNEYTNLFDSYDAECENLGNFNTYEYKEPEKGEVGREIDTDFYHNGNGSLKITIPGSYRTLAGIAPTEKLVAGKNYTVSVWYYKTNAVNQAIYFRYASAYSHGNWITGTAHDTQTTMVSDKWTKYTFNFTASSDLVDKLRYFYITTTATSGEMYLDGFELRMVPDAETELITDDLGEFDSISEATLEFDKEIDKSSLSDNIKIDGADVAAETALSDDGKSVTVKFAAVSAPGAHTLSLECADIWNRTVNASASFKIAGEETDVYDNLFNQPTADCDSIDEFNANAFTNEPVDISIDTGIYHSGTSSIRTFTEKEYRPLILMKPNTALISGRQYTFSAWYYIPESFTGTKKILLRYSRNNNTNISNWVTGVAFDSGVAAVSGKWTKFEFTFTATDSLASDTFSNFYLTPDFKNITIYFDDIALRKVPDSATTLLTTDLGSVDTANALTLSFDKPLDKHSLPENILIDGNTVDSDIILSNDGKTLTVTVNSSVTAGSHTMTLACDDLWNRKVNASATFSVKQGSTPGGNEPEEPGDNGDNLIAKGTASCESISEFSSAAFVNEPVDISIDNVTFHSGTGSLKAVFDKQYKPLAVFAPIKRLTAGKTYQFSTWYYTETAFTGTKRLFLRYSKNNNTNISNWVTGVTYDSGAAMTGGKWTKYTFTFTASDALSSDEFSNFYLTSEMPGGTIYFDDMSLMQVPDKTASLVKSDFGKLESLTKLTLEFDMEIDEATLPSNVMIDGNAVAVDATLSSNGKKITLEFNGSVSAGSHTMILTCRDTWNRPVNATVTFELEKESGTASNIYANLIDTRVAACESEKSLKEFNDNAFPDSASRYIDEEIYHSGTASIMTESEGAYKPLMSFKPNAAFIPGEEYYFSVWYYTEDVTGTKRLYLRYSKMNNTNISNWITGVDHDSASNMTNGKWTKYEFRFTATEALASEEFTSLYVSSEMPGGTVYFDDFNLRRVSPDTVSMVDHLPKQGDEDVKLDHGFRIELTGQADTSDVTAQVYINGELDDSGIICENKGNTLVIMPKGGLLPDNEYKFVVSRICDAYGRVIFDYTEKMSNALSSTFTTSQKLGFDISYTDESGNKLTTVKSGAIKAGINAENNTGAEITFRAVVMACEGQSVKKVYTSDLITANADEVISDIDLSIDEVPDNCYLKAVLWTEDSGLIRTASDCIEFR